MLKYLVLIRTKNYYYWTTLVVLEVRYSGYTLRSEIEASLITREVLPETYFLLVIMAGQLMLRQDHFWSFKHHADVEPCKVLVSLAASSISEI
jgi:hypothetical protein